MLAHFLCMRYPTKSFTDASFNVQDSNGSFERTPATVQGSIHLMIIYFNTNERNEFLLPKVGFDDHNCRDTQESGVEFIPQLLTLPPPGTCLILPLEPHFDWTLLKSNF